MSLSVAAAADQTSLSQLTLVHADLVTPAGARPVTLPHVLSAKDFLQAGGIVTYRMSFSLGGLPSRRSGIYIPKASLSGLLRLNDQILGSCAPGELHRLRCLHTPMLLEVPSSVWRQGLNVLEVDVYATGRQINGLSAITIGDHETLYKDRYLWNRFWQNDVLNACLWLSLSFGLVSLAVGFVFRSDSVYLWFGAASILSALSNVNYLFTRVVINPEAASWMIYSVRLVSLSLMLMTALVYFARFWKPLAAWRIFHNALAAYTVTAPVIIWLSGNSREAVSTLYVPLIGAYLVIAAGMIFWANRSRRMLDILLTLSFCFIPGFVAADWLRLKGDTQLEGVYFLSYATMAMIFVMAAVIVGILVSALKTERELTDVLEKKVEISESSLNRVYAEVIRLEQLNARRDERERMLKDMHDGLGSQLNSARINLETGKMTAQQAGQVMQECLDDLNLLFESTGSEGELEHSLADFRHRIDKRLSFANIDSVWDVSLDHLPSLAPGSQIQLMRIVQEALNNVLRHAGATQVRISVKWDKATRRLHIHIEDNGKGIGGTDTGRRHRGLSNMRVRSAALNANIEFRNTGAGTLVHLAVPVSVEPRLYDIAASV